MFQINMLNNHYALNNLIFLIQEKILDLFSEFESETYALLHLLKILKLGRTLLDLGRLKSMQRAMLFPTWAKMIFYIFLNA